MLNKILTLFVFFSCNLLPELTVAQHCPPILESYLSSVIAKRSKDGVAFTFSYAKSGGQPKAAYQSYILVYADADAGKISELTPQKAIADGIATVLHTQIAKGNNEGNYEFECKLDVESFVSGMQKSGKLSKDKAKNFGSWKRYPTLRLAVFIPFLDDKEYSVLKELPDDRHECNYNGDAALLFQPLTQQLTVRKYEKSGKHTVSLNGIRHAKNHNPDIENSND
jgi:hypothetical protein